MTKIEENKIKTYQKCKDDSLYFYKKYISLNGTRLKLTAFQKIKLKKFLYDDYKTIYMPSMSGKTILAALITIHKFIFNDNNVLLMSNDKNITKIIWMIIKNIPEFIAGGIKKISHNEYILNDKKLLINRENLDVETVICDNVYIKNANVIFYDDILKGIVENANAI
jgi:hypothetical protein